MKQLRITVAGQTFDVTVETVGGSLAAAPAPAPAPAPAGAQGGIEVAASVPGKVFQIPSSVGDAVSAGDTIIVLESMKMEIPVVAPESGTIASINVTVGAQVETGDLLATLN